MLRLRCAVLLFSVFSTTQAAWAQTPRFEVEGAAGRAWFLDESAIAHGLVGGAVRWRVTPRLSLGPEFTYWRGPGDDRDQTLTANLSYDFRDRGAIPFVIVGAGIFRHSDRFAGQTYSTNEGSYTLGGGVRVALQRGWYVSPEWRTGWEPHMRVHVAVGRHF